MDISCGRIFCIIELAGVGRLTDSAEPAIKLDMVAKVKVYHRFVDKDIDVVLDICPAVNRCVNIENCQSELSTILVRLIIVPFRVVSIFSSATKFLKLFCRGFE